MMRGEKTQQVTYLLSPFSLGCTVEYKLEPHIQFRLDHLGVLQEEIGIVGETFLLFGSI